MLKMLFNDIERKIKETPDQKIILGDNYKQEYSGRTFTHIDINGVYYFDKSDDSEKQDNMIAWYAVPQALFMKIYNYVMDIK